jgi:hypothetical protein
MSCGTVLALKPGRCVRGQSAGRAAKRLALRRRRFEREMVREDGSDSNLREAIGCLGLFLLFVVCVAAPSFAYHSFGPWAAILAAATALGAWAYLGPPPFPGLLQGTLGLGVFLNGIGWAGFSLYIVFRAWLNS